MTDPATIPAPAAPAPTAQPRLADLLAQHPHIQDELTAEVQRVAGKEKAQGLRSGAHEWARSLGLESPDAVAEIVKAHQAQQQARMTEAEKAQQDAERARLEAEKLLQDAKAKNLRAAAIAALREADAQDPALLAPALTEFGITVDSTDDEIRGAVEQMKQRSPGSFGAKPSGTPAADPGKPPAGSPGATGTGVGDVGSQAKSQIERIVSRKGKAPIPGQR